MSREENIFLIFFFAFPSIHIEHTLAPKYALEQKVTVMTVFIKYSFHDDKHEDKGEHVYANMN